MSKENDVRSFRLSDGISITFVAKDDREDLSMRIDTNAKFINESFSEVAKLCFDREIKPIDMFIMASILRVMSERFINNTFKKIDEAMGDKEDKLYDCLKKNMPTILRKLEEYSSEHYSLIQSHIETDKIMKSIGIKPAPMKFDMMGEVIDGKKKNSGH